MPDLSKLFTITAATLTAFTLAATATAPALADPPRRFTPRPADIVGVGSGILQNLFDQYSQDYNKTVSAKAPHLYSFDAIDPITGGPTPITPKRGCKPRPRPSDSSGGIIALLKLNEVFSATFTRVACVRIVSGQGLRARWDLSRSGLR